ncbi:hypothetical protein ANN_17102 [Periplaneta americana]|uniref:Uncharacterized protein n=1 Tax=Periplaneta americana TaxID=6978 RepID=A0ABQ8STB4_PERAM|nr:hypothetical protein ANN_17102 [Periplaneta americana]
MLTGLDGLDFRPCSVGTRVTECPLVRVLMGKEISHEISASVWYRCPPSIVMHLRSYDRDRYNGSPQKHHRTITRHRITIQSRRRKQRIPNLTGPVNNNDVTLQQNRNQTAGRFDGCHSGCTNSCLCYASRILRNFRTVISFKEKRA